MVDAGEDRELTLADATLAQLAGGARVEHERAGPPTTDPSELDGDRHAAWGLPVTTSPAASPAPAATPNGTLQCRATGPPCVTLARALTMALTGSVAAFDGSSATGGMAGRR